MKMFLQLRFNGFALLATMLLIGNSAIAAGALTVAASAQSGTPAEVVMNPDHPDRYTVVKGDTLWDISGMFLRDPWLWPEIWSVNPQIENPHLIYPGDILALVWIDGKPQLQLQRGMAGSLGPASGDEKMQPGVRVSDSQSAIPTIPFERISAFLSRAGVARKRDMEKLPHIAALRFAMVAGAGNEVYVRGLDNALVGDVYGVIRLGEELIDPENGKSLGYEIVYVGSGTIAANSGGGVDKLMLNDTTREAKEGDRVLQIDAQPPENFYPRGPDQKVEGQIVAVKDGVSRIGQYQMVIINRGLSSGLEQGNVMSIWKIGEETEDAFASRGMRDNFTLPDERIGLLMVVKPEENTSYALIMDASSEIRVDDRIRNP